MVRGDDLRALMRRVPAPVAVVSVDVDGERLGLTVGSVVSLSLDPPLLAVGVSRQAALHELLRRAETFGVSFLAADQERVAQHFARGVPPIGLWTNVELREGEGPPLLAGAAAWAVCRRTEEHPGGDHTLFEGEVLTAEIGPGAGALVYLQQRYVPV